MNLESYPVGDNQGMAQFHMHLSSLTIQLEEMIKGKEKCEKIWCTKCRTEGYHNDECISFTQYLAMEALNLLSGGRCYEICKKWGHHPIECPLL
jgi:hypothetical protein